MTNHRRPYLLRVALYWLDGGRYEHVLGDLEEEFDRLRHTGPMRARWWLWRQLFGLVLYRSMRPRQRTAASRVGLVAETWLQDIGLGIRLLRRNLLVGTTVIITLALGIGAPATMFTIARGILRDLPFDDADKIVLIGIRDVIRGVLDEGVTTVDFTEWRGAQTTMVDIAAMRRTSFQMTAADAPPLRVEGAAISPWAFALVGVAPILGRDFTVADLESGSPPVIIGYQLWQDAFDGEHAVLGQSIRVDGKVRTVIGVMPEGFGFPRSEHLWIPLNAEGTAMASAESPFSAFGLVAAHAEIEDARNELAMLGSLSPDGSRRPADEAAVFVEPFTHQFVGSDGPMLLYTMLAIVSTVLIIACVNVTNILLAQASARSREIGIRAALGGTRTRLLRQLLTETMVLALLGGMGGVVVATAAVRWFNATVGYRLDIFWVAITVDAAVLAFIFAITTAGTVAAGVVPALHASRIDVVRAIKEGTGGMASMGMARLTRTLVVAEIALSCILLVASGLMVRGVVGLSRLDVQFDTAEIMTARIELGAFDYPDDDALRAMYRELADGWSAKGPGELTLWSRVPGRGGTRWTFMIEGVAHDGDAALPAVAMRTVSTGFVNAFRADVIAGRAFDARDGEHGAPVALVNTAFADRFFQGDAEGRRLRMGDATSTEPWRRIVGVIDDRGLTLEESRAAPGIFIPMPQKPARNVTLTARHPAGLEVAITSMRQVVSSIDANLPVFAAASLDEVLWSENAPQRAFAILFGAFGIGALLLAAVGLYGTLAFSVQQRQKEIGLRQALGATSHRVVTHVLRSAAIQLAVGLAIGMSASILIAPLIGEFTFGADPRDPLVFFLVVTSLLLTTLTASLTPAVRAARIDPMQVIRGD